MTHTLIITTPLSNKMKPIVTQELLDVLLALITKTKTVGKYRYFCRFPDATTVVWKAIQKLG